jgi:hypothetical protein
MKNKNISRRNVLQGVGTSIAGAGISSSVFASGNTQSDCLSSTSSTRQYSLKDLDLSTPEKKSAVVTKVMGSVLNEDTHAFLRFHIYGYAGKNVIPFFSMNNYVVQRWQPTDDFGTYQLKHYEVGYYTKFDTDDAISEWQNPFTKEVVQLEHFVLGPVHRVYTPTGIIAPGIAPQPLRVNVIGDRVFVPAQSIEKFPNMFPPEEWPELSNGPENFWDSMYTYSAYLRDVLNPNIGSAPAEIHMQNLTSWQPFLHLGRTEGRSMARAFGGNISGFNDLPEAILKDFEKYTPEIFGTDTWEEVRFDSVDYYKKKMAEKKRTEGSK